MSSRRWICLEREWTITISGCDEVKRIFGGIVEGGMSSALHSSMSAYNLLSLRSGELFLVRFFSKLNHVSKYNVLDPEQWDTHLEYEQL